MTQTTEGQDYRNKLVAMINKPLKLIHAMTQTTTHQAETPEETIETKAEIYYGSENIAAMNTAIAQLKKEKVTKFSSRGFGTLAKEAGFILPENKNYINYDAFLFQHAERIYDPVKRKNSFWRMIGSNNNFNEEREKYNNRNATNTPKLGELEFSESEVTKEVKQPEVVDEVTENDNHSPNPFEILQRVNTALQNYKTELIMDEIDVLLELLKGCNDEEASDNYYNCIRALRRNINV